MMKFHYDEQNMVLWSVIKETIRLGYNVQIEGTQGVKQMGIKEVDLVIKYQS